MSRETRLKRWLRKVEVDLLRGEVRRPLGVEGEFIGTVTLAELEAAFSALELVSGDAELPVRHRAMVIVRAYHARLCALQEVLEGETQVAAVAFTRLSRRRLRRSLRHDLFMAVRAVERARRDLEVTEANIEGRQPPWWSGETFEPFPPLRRKSAPERVSLDDEPEVLDRATHDLWYASTFSMEV